MRQHLLGRAALIVTCAGLMAVLGCAALSWYWPSVVPDQSTSELAFSHKRHVDMDIECTACHAALESLAATDVLLPVETTCMSCHDRKQGCELCHGNANAVIPLEARNYGLRFAHETHLREDVNDNGCETCHATVASSTMVAETHWIGAWTCQQCHDSEMGAQERCGMCHDQMQTNGFVPASHDTEWLRRHGTATSSSVTLCDVCHRGGVRADFVDGPSAPKTTLAADHAQRGPVGDCADCHLADVWTQRIHQPGYLQSHPLDARFDTTTCESCHQRDECRACHAASGLTYSDAHPPGFILNHAAEARRDLGSCTACHTEDSCIACHQSANPHPAGWDLEITAQNRSLCLKCHAGVGISDLD